MGYNIDTLTPKDAKMRQVKENDRANIYYILLVTSKITGQFPLLDDPAEVVGGFLHGLLEDSDY